MTEGHFARRANLRECRDS